MTDVLLPAPHEQQEWTAPSPESHEAAPFELLEAEYGLGAFAVVEGVERPASVDSMSDDEMDALPGWDYTMNANEALRMAAQKRLYDEPDPGGFEIPSVFENRPTISRDTRINGGVYVVPGNQEAIVVDTKKHADNYVQIFKDLAVAIQPEKPSKFRKARPLTEEQILEKVFELTAKNMEYDKEYANKIKNKYADRKVELGLLLAEGKGVCRHQALLAAALLEKLIDDGTLDGTVSVDRNSIPGVGGHAWTRYTKKSGEVQIIDIAQKLNASLDSTVTNQDQWDYRRPGEQGMVSQQARNEHKARKIAEAEAKKAEALALEAERVVARDGLVNTHNSLRDELLVEAETIDSTREQEASEILHTTVGLARGMYKESSDELSRYVMNLYDADFLPVLQKAAEARGFSQDYINEHANSVKTAFEAVLFGGLRQNVNDANQARTMMQASAAIVDQMTGLIDFRESITGLEMSLDTLAPKAIYFDNQLGYLIDNYKKSAQ